MLTFIIAIAAIVIYVVIAMAVPIASKNMGANDGDCDYFAAIIWPLLLVAYVAVTTLAWVVVTMAWAICWAHDTKIWKSFSGVWEQ
jgi:uncharacterized membrane protein